MNENVNMEEIESLALLNTLKNIICDLPFGGASGGIRSDNFDLNFFLIFLIVIIFF